MKNGALRKLEHRGERLRSTLQSGTTTEVKAARELLRQSLVELYELGHWQSQPNDLQDYMQLYRRAEPRPPVFTSAPEFSKAGPSI